MLIKTKHFGEVEIDEANVLSFEDGVFGFEEDKSFVLLYDGEADASPFCWLQAIGDEKTCLPLINPVHYFPNYDPEIAGDLVARIGELKEEDLQLFTVVVVPEDIKKMTTNLMAPILINIKTKKGIQVIVSDEEYQIKHNLYDQFMLLKEESE